MHVLFSEDLDNASKKGGNGGYGIREPSAPFVRLDIDSTIEDVTIFYPEQKVSDIRPYPWTIQGSGTRLKISG
jgi:hypothetical protein